MAYVIISRHGLKQNLPASAPLGELFVTTDTDELFVGTGTGMAQIAKSSAPDAFFAFSQNVAAATWVVVHNLGKFPSVSVVDSSGHLVFGDVQYNSNNSLTIFFSAAFAGNAYLN
jgi:hypothetical protein